MMKGPQPSLSAAAADLTTARLQGISSETVELGVALVRASHSHASRSESLLHSRRGLTWLSFRMLYLIWLMEPVTARDLAKLLRVSRQTTSNALRSLESQNLISRVRDTADQRRITIRVSDSGRDKVEELVRDQFRLDMRWFGALDESEQLVLAKLLERLRASIERRDIDPHEVLHQES